MERFIFPPQATNGDVELLEVRWHDARHGARAGHQCRDGDIKSRAPWSTFNGTLMFSTFFAGVLDLRKTNPTATGTTRVADDLGATLTVRALPGEGDGSITAADGTATSAYAQSIIVHDTQGVLSLSLSDGATGLLSAVRAALGGRILKAHVCVWNRPRQNVQF